MRDKILERIEQLFLIYDLFLDKCKDVDDPSLADFDLRLAYLPLDGRNQHLLQELLADGRHSFMQVCKRDEIFKED